MSDPPPFPGEPTDDGLFAISATGLTATEVDSLRAWKRSMDARRTMDGKEAAEIEVSHSRARRSKSANPRPFETDSNEEGGGGGGSGKHVRRSAHSISVLRSSRPGTTGDLEEALRGARAAWPDEGQPLRMSARAREESDPISANTADKRIQPRVARRLNMSEDLPPRRETRTSSPHLRKNHPVFSADDNFPLVDRSEGRGERKLSSNSRTLMSPARALMALGGIGNVSGPDRLERSQTAHDRRTAFYEDRVERFERGMTSDKNERSSGYSDKGSFERSDNGNHIHQRFFSPERGEGIPASPEVTNNNNNMQFLSPEKTNIDRSSAFTPDRGFSQTTTNERALFSPSSADRNYSPSSSRFSDRGLFVDPDNVHNHSPNPARKALIDDVWQGGGREKPINDGAFTMAVDPKDRRGPPHIRIRDSPSKEDRRDTSIDRDTPVVISVELPTLLPPDRSISRGLLSPNQFSRILSPKTESSSSGPSANLNMEPADRQESSRLLPDDLEPSEAPEERKITSKSSRRFQPAISQALTPPSRLRSLNKDSRNVAPPTPPGGSPRGSVEMEEEPLNRKFPKRSDETMEYAVPPSRDLDIEYFGSGTANNSNSNIITANSHTTTTEEFSENRKRRRPDTQSVEYFNKDSATPSSTLLVPGSPPTRVTLSPETLPQPSSTHFSPSNHMRTPAHYPSTPSLFSAAYSSNKMQRKGAISPLQSSYSPGIGPPQSSFVGILRHEVTVIPFRSAHSWMGFLLALLSAYWLATCVASAWLSAAWTPTNKYGDFSWAPALVCFLWVLLAVFGLSSLMYSFFGWRARMPVLYLDPKEKCMRDLVRDVHDDVAGAQSELAINYLEARVDEKAAVLSSRSDWDADMAFDLKELIYRLEPQEQTVSYKRFMQFLADLAPMRVPRVSPCNVNHSQFQNFRGILYIGMMLLLSFCLMLTCQLPLPHVIAFQFILALVCVASLCCISTSLILTTIQCLFLLMAGTFPLVHNTREVLPVGNCQSHVASTKNQFSLEPIDMLQIGYVPHIISLLLLCAMCQYNTQNNITNLLSGRKQALSPSLGDRLVNTTLTKPTKKHVWRGPLVAVFFLAVAWGVCVIIVVISELWYGACETVPACAQPRFLCGFDIWHACTCFDAELCLNNRSLTTIPDLTAWSRLRYLDISNNYIVDLPPYLCFFSDFTLMASSNLIKSVPPCLGVMYTVNALNLSFNELAYFPPHNMKDLLSLDLSHNRLTNFSVQSSSLQTLRLSLNQIQQIELNTPLLLELDVSRNPLGKITGLEDLRSLTLLKASNAQLSELPLDFYLLNQLKECDLSNNKLTKLPNPTTSTISTSPALIRFNLANNKIKELPAGLGGTSGWFKSLQELDLSSNALTGLPATLGDFSVLRFLSVQNNMINALTPSVLQGLTSLQTLLLSFNALARLPSQLSKLSALTRLEVAYNLLETIPSGVGSLQELRQLSLSSNVISTVPAGLVCPSLVSLDLSRNRLVTEELSFLSSLTNLNTLNLRENMITTWVDALQFLSKLTRLDLAKNLLTLLPLSLPGLSQLQQLDLSSNLLTSLPLGLSDLEFLTQLILANNHITSNELELANRNSTTTSPSRVWCPLLKQLDLSTNLLRACPVDVKYLRQLEILDISNNPIQSFPEWLPSLPALMRLRASGMNASLANAKNGSVLPICGSQLLDLDISGNGITELDDAFTSSCKGLRNFDASRNMLQILPESFTNLTSLDTLRLISNPLCHNQYCNWAPSAIKLILDVMDACGV